jgi:aryl-alcohol dehydrogenase-like predicted oxidoreductase
MSARTNTPAAAGGEFLLGDRPVNRLGLGAMRLALGGSIRDPDAAIELLRRAADLGVNHIDTAGFYGVGSLRSHELIREALWPYANDMVLATKVGPLFKDGGLPPGQAGPDDLRGLVENDLRRLGQDQLDLLYLRTGLTDDAGGESIGERFAVLADLRREGLVRHLGVSNVDTAQLEEARSIAPVAAVQNPFHIHDRRDADVLALCEREAIAYVPYFPLGGGKVKIDFDRLTKIAARNAATTRQIALAWLLATSPVTLAVPGTSSLDHLVMNVAAAGTRLAPADLVELTEQTPRDWQGR